MKMEEKNRITYAAATALADVKYFSGGDDQEEG